MILSDASEDSPYPPRAWECNSLDATLVRTTTTTAGQDGYFPQASPGVMKGLLRHFFNRQVSHGPHAFFNLLLTRHNNAIPNFIDVEDHSRQPETARRTQTSFQMRDVEHHVERLLKTTSPQYVASLRLRPCLKTQMDAA